jgi:hypothetical protein
MAFAALGAAEVVSIDPNHEASRALLSQAAGTIGRAQRSLLAWLLETESRGGHLSLTATGGWGPGEDRRTFDQQPIEAASLSDACVRAFACTDDPSWLAGIELSVRWFEGHNDAGVPLLDPVSGGGYDGLTRGGRNTNQGAESTLALITTTQHRRVLALARQAPLGASA